MWFQCAMWRICRLITVAAALCSGNVPIHTDCALANHSNLSSRGAAFAPRPIERHLAETSKMAAKEVNWASVWFFFGFFFFLVFQELEYWSDRLQTSCNISLAPVNPLNNSFTYMLLVSTVLVCLASAMPFVVSLPTICYSKTKPEAKLTLTFFQITD